MAEAARRTKVSEQSVGTWKRQFLEAGKLGLAPGGMSRPSSREEQLAAQVEDLTSALGEAHVELRCGRSLLRAAWPLRGPRGDTPGRGDAGLEVLPADRHPAPYAPPLAGPAAPGRAAGKGPWPAPAVEAIEPVAAKYAANWPGWGHRKICALMAADGHQASVSTVERAMRRRGLLHPVDYQGQRRELAKARKAAFADPPARCNEVWQLDFSEYEITAGGIWRLAGVTDYFSKYEHGWHISPTCTGADAIAAVQIAITEAERLGGAPLAQLPVHPETGGPVRIKLVTDIQTRLCPEGPGSSGRRCEDFGVRHPLAVVA